MITPFFPSKIDYRGNYIYNQILEIQKQSGLNIQIIKVVSLFSKESDYNFKGFKISVFKIIDFPFFIFPGLFHFINNKRIILFIKEKGISNIKIIHAHITYPSSYLTNVISREVNTKTIVQHHGIDVLQLKNGRLNILKKIQRKFLIKRSIKQLNKVDVNIGVSQKVLDELRLFKGYYSKSEYVMYNGVDTTKFFPMHVKKDNHFVIGCIANFFELKDHISLIKAVEQLFLDGYDVKLKLIGTGPTFSKCYSYVKNNNLLNIISFEKEQEYDQLNIFYNKIDLFVMPSFYEALGCVYLEAWATNTPFIAIQGQGIAEPVPKDKKEIFLAEAQNSYSLKNCIANIIDSKESVKFNDKYRIENTVFNFLKLFLSR